LAHALRLGERGDKFLQKLLSKDYCAKAGEVILNYGS
jgi:hypothetical protein